MARSKIPAELRELWDATEAAPDERDEPTAGRGNSDRFAVLNAFVDVTLRELCRAEIAVWFTLYRDTKPDGLARTSQADLARRAGVNAGTVKRAVARLARRGLLTVVHRGSLRQGPSTYRVRPLTRDYKK